MPTLFFYNLYDIAVEHVLVCELINVAVFSCVAFLLFKSKG